MSEQIVFNLPDLLVSKILSALGGKNLARASCVCKQWKAVAWKNPEAWRSAYEIDYGGLPYQPTRRDWRATYLLEHRWRNDYDVEPERIIAHQRGVMCLTFDETYIVSGGWDATIKIWSTETLALLGALTGHTREVVCLSKAGDRLISGSCDSTIRIWDFEGRMCEAALMCLDNDGENMSVNCLDSAKDTCVSGHDGGFLKITNTKSGVCTDTLQIHEGNIMDVHLDLSKNRLVTSSIDLTIKMWAFDTMECLNTFGDDRSIHCLSVVDNLIICGSVAGLIVLWDEEECNDVLILNGKAPRVRCVHFDGKRVVSAADDRLLKLWDVTSKTCLREFHGHTGLVVSVKFNDTKLVSCGIDDTICIWDFDQPVADHDPQVA